MQKIADGQDYKVPATIEDPAVLTEIDESLRRVGYAKKQGVSSPASKS
jgi:propionyl-CoA synthetase